VAGEQQGQAGRVRQDASAERDAFTAARDQIFNLAPEAEKAAPGLLPRDVPDFTGRDGELGRVTALAGGGSVVVTAIGGTAGVGKTALAVHAAHRLLSRFPGGHLYADLRGYTEGTSPAEPGEVLDVFLRRLDVPPGELPAGVEERSGLLRQLLADRPVLMVLDNAATEAQVRPLLPGAGSSLVLITSRSALAGLDLDDRIDLDVLPDAEAAALLADLVGHDRAAAEPEAIAQVARWCGCLPLALRIAGQLLAAHPAWPVSRLAGLLADERHRLDRLAAGDRQVRAAFEVSYRQLADGDARVFRLLGLHPGPDFDASAAAALAGLDPDAVEPVLERLTLAHLISEDTQGRFRMHDLLRLFTRQRCEADDDDAARREAMARLLDHFQNLATVLSNYLNPERHPDRVEAAGRAGMQIPTPRQVLALFEADRRNLLAAITMATGLEQHQKVWELCEDVAETLALLRHLDDLAIVCRAALSAARAAKNRTAEDRALNNLGNAYMQLGQFEEAISCLQQDLAICREAGDQRGEAETLNNLGNVYTGLQQYDESVACLQDALVICRKIGYRRLEGGILSNLGIGYRWLQRLEDAIACYQDALVISREVGDQHLEGHILTNLGNAYYDQQRFEDAIGCYEQDLAICRELGDRHGEGLTLLNLGATYQRLQRYDDAVSSYRDGIEAMRETGDGDKAARAEEDLERALYEMRQRGRRHWWRRVRRT